MTHRLGTGVWGDDPTPQSELSSSDRGVEVVKGVELGYWGCSLCRKLVRAHAYDRPTHEQCGIYGDCMRPMREVETGRSES